MMKNTSRLRGNCPRHCHLESISLSNTGWAGLWQPLLQILALLLSYCRTSGQSLHFPACFFLSFLVPLKGGLFFGLFGFLVYFFSWALLRLVPVSCHCYCVVAQDNNLGWPTLSWGLQQLGRHGGSPAPGVICLSPLLGQDTCNTFKRSS